MSTYYYQVLSPSVVPLALVTSADLISWGTFGVVCSLFLLFSLPPPVISALIFTGTNFWSGAFGKDGVVPPGESPTDMGCDPGVPSLIFGVICGARGDRWSLRFASRSAESFFCCNITSCNILSILATFFCDFGVLDPVNEENFLAECSMLQALKSDQLFRSLHTVLCTELTTHVSRLFMKKMRKVKYFRNVGQMLWLMVKVTRLFTLVPVEYACQLWNLYLLWFNSYAPPPMRA